MQAKCTTCGTSVENTGNCQACLLQLGISQASSSPVNVPHAVNLPSIDELNKHFPQLEINRLVGRGGMGAIYQARQTALDRDVALKLIAREVADNVAFIERFEREAKTLAKLSHPHIVTIYDFGRTADGQAYLIMEFVDGINLREALSAKSVGHDDALDIVSAICKALAYAHSKGVVHRDIKPENILLGEDGTLKVADFGIAKLVDEANGIPVLTATRQVLGSLNYLAPEQLESPDEVDHRVDLYALGVVFYELLTGQLPLGRFEPPSAVDAQVDHRFDAIVMKTLNRKPVKRYQQAVELDSDIFQLRSSLSSQAVAPQKQAIDQRVSRSHGTSVPFSCEAMAGWAEVVGVLYATPDLLRAEFRTRDKLFGQLKTKTQVLAIPTSKLRVAELRTGVFSSTIVLMADNLSTFDSFPNSETGRIELKITRAEYAQAAAVVQTLGISEVGQTRAGTQFMPTEKEVQEEHVRWTTMAIVFILCSVINMGSLAAILVLMNSDLQDVELIMGVILVSVLIAPVFLLQLLTGCVGLVARPRSLAVATSVVSLLPISPGWIVSFPVGLWTLRWLRGATLLSANSKGTTASPTGGASSWGATTMIFLRESRWSKFVAIANVAALLLAITLYAGYRAGYYPVTLEYRVVGQEVDRWELAEALRNRLPAASIEVSSLNAEKYELSDIASRVKLRIMANQRTSTREQIKIERNVELVWLKAKDATNVQAPENSVTERMWDLAPDLNLDQVEQRTVSLGKQVVALGEPIILRADLVRELTQVRGAMLGQEIVELEFSEKGRELLNVDARTPSQTAGLGIIIQGVVQGFASRQDITSTKSHFSLAVNSVVTAPAIIAAVRGPELPTELEYLP